MIFREITAYIFLAFGWLCITVIGYLVLAWLFNFKIGKSKIEYSSDVGEINASIRVHFEKKRNS